MAVFILFWFYTWGMNLFDDFPNHNNREFHLSCMFFGTHRASGDCSTTGVEHLVSIMLTYIPFIRARGAAPLVSHAFFLWIFKVRFIFRTLAWLMVSRLLFSFISNIFKQLPF